MKTHWKKLQNPNYIGAWDFQPKEEKILKIKSVGVESVPDVNGKKEDCTVCHFDNSGTKPMILNVTNSKAIAKVAGSNYIEDWAGVHVQLFTTQVKAFGDVVDAVRIRPIKPEIKKPELTPTHPKWSEVKGKVKAKEVTFETIRKHYSLSIDNEKLLQS